MQGFGRLHAGRDVLGEDDDAADDAWGGVPGLDFPAQSLTLSVGQLEQVLLGGLNRPGQTALVDLFPALGKLREYFVMAAPEDLLA